jgi:acyl-CoA thioester hydrolase
VSRELEFRIRTRWPDFDALGHLNHAAYHVYLDEARDDALRRTVGDFDTWPNVVAHASIDYRREIPLGTREVVVRTRIAAVGTSSVRFEQAVLDESGEVAASGEAILVAWDREARRSRAVTDAERGLTRAAGLPLARLSVNVAVWTEPLMAAWTVFLPTTSVTFHASALPVQRTV